MSPFHRTLAFLCLILVSALASPLSRAQITNVTNSTQPPIPGAGHDYLKALNETVNPANGSVSVRIAPFIPPGSRLSFPFAFTYDSGPAQHLQPDGAGENFWVDNRAYLGKGGWSYSVPMISDLEVRESLGGGAGSCTYYL